MSLFCNFLCIVLFMKWDIFILIRKKNQETIFLRIKAVRHPLPVACLITAPELSPEGKTATGGLLLTTSEAFFYTPFSSTPLWQLAPADLSFPAVLFRTLICPNFLSVAFGVSLTWVWRVTVASISCVISVSAPHFWDGTRLPHWALNRMQSVCGAQHSPFHIKEHILVF